MTKFVTFPDAIKWGWISFRWFRRWSKFGLFVLWITPKAHRRTRCSWHRGLDVIGPALNGFRNCAGSFSFTSTSRSWSLAIFSLLHSDGNWLMHPRSMTSWTWVTDQVLWFTLKVSEVFVHSLRFGLCRTPVEPKGGFGWSGARNLQLNSKLRRILDSLF